MCWFLLKTERYAFHGETEGSSASIGNTYYLFINLKKSTRYYFAFSSFKPNMKYEVTVYLWNYFEYINCILLMCNNNNYANSKNLKLRIIKVLKQLVSAQRRIWINHVSGNGEASGNWPVDLYLHDWRSLLCICYSAFNFSIACLKFSYEQACHEYVFQRKAEVMDNNLTTKFYISYCSPGFPNDLLIHRTHCFSCSTSSHFAMYVYVL